MESDSRINGLLRKLNEKLAEQVWFQQLRGKWEELDVQSRTYIRYAAGGFSGLLVLIILISAVVGARSSKQELEERTRLLMLVRNANEQMRQMGTAGPRRTGAPSGPWNSYFTGLASSSGIQEQSLSVGQEKKLPEGQSTEESIFQISMEKINVRQLVRYAYQLENGGRPVKIRQMIVDARGETTGYLNAKLEVSAFESKGGE